MKKSFESFVNELTSESFLTTFQSIKGDKKRGSFKMSDFND